MAKRRRKKAKRKRGRTIVFQSAPTSISPAPTMFIQRRPIQLLLAGATLLGFLLLPPRPQVTVPQPRVSKFFDTEVHIDNAGLTTMENVRTEIVIDDFEFGIPGHLNKIVNGITLNQNEYERISYFGNGYDLPLAPVVDIPTAELVTAKVTVRVLYQLPYITFWTRVKDVHFNGKLLQGGDWYWAMVGS